MKKWFFLSMMALVCFSCYTDEAVINPEIKFNPEEESSPYVIPVEEALQTLTTALERIDGSTRSGRMRSPLSVDRVKMAEAVAITRSAELPDVEDLFYIVSFGEGNGSAVLGADRRLDKIYAILDETVLTPEDFYLLPTRSEGLNGGTENESETTDEPKMISSDEELEEFVTGMMVDSAVGTLAVTLPGPDLPGLPGLPGLPDVPTFPKYKIIITEVVQENSFISPCLKTKWGQGSYYNNFCPSKSVIIPGKDPQCPAGCTAIALAQFINYKRLPNFSQIRNYTFSWELLNQCNFGTSPDENAKNEVARFIYYIGLDAGMEYSDNGSGAWMQDFVPTFTTMGFSAGEIAYSFPTAKGVIKDRDLICITGWGRDENNEKFGHTWILDGLDVYIYVRVTRTFTETGQLISTVTTDIERRELFHCNFGWEGKCDGYYAYPNYRFDTSNPINQSNEIGDWGTGIDIYNFDFTMLYY